VTCNSKMYAASSSSTASSTSSTGSQSDHRASAQSTTVHRQRSHKSTSRNQTSTSTPTLQSLVRTKCWSIAPLWKFVTYELETQPENSSSTSNLVKNFARSASVRNKPVKHHKSISYENNFYNMASTASNHGGHRSHRGPIWSKPHPHQSFTSMSAASNKSVVSNNHAHGPPEPPPRQPLQLANRISTLEQPCKIHHPVLTPNNSNSSSGSNESSNSETEWKPCGVLKKPGSYRSHAGLKKVAFLENTELNRSTL